MIEILKSSEDTSVNFVIPCDDGGFFEARFVQREPDYFIVYLSSHSGCDKTCRFCHLTATGQTMMTPAHLECYVEQAKLVIQHYVTNVRKEVPTETTVHFNFMARGEPLCNETLVYNSQLLYNALHTLVEPLGLRSKFKISTIMPTGFDTDQLLRVFNDSRSELYYSLYSVNPTFRKRWLPNAMDVNDVLPLLAEYQRSTNVLLEHPPITIHWAFIQDANDSERDVEELVDLVVNKHRIKCKFNLIRYNPYDSRYGMEPSEEVIQNRFAIISNPMTATGSRIVPRVGFDVKASCGMFV